MKPNISQLVAQFLARRADGAKGIGRLVRSIHPPDRRFGGHFDCRTNCRRDGLLFDVDTRWFLEWRLFYYGSLDRSIHHFMATTVKSDWVVMDVGANFGFYSCLLARQTAQVHAFEPVPFLIERARHNAALNHLSNVVFQEMAVSHQAGQVLLHLPLAEDENWGQSSLVNPQSGQRLSVECTTLDAYSKRIKLSRLDFIKIDVEGAEHWVLAGGIKTLERFRPIVLFENNSSSLSACRSLLQAIGYEIQTLRGQILSASQVPASREMDLVAVPNGAKIQQSGRGVPPLDH